MITMLSCQSEKNTIKGYWSISETNIEELKPSEKLSYDGSIIIKSFKTMNIENKYLYVSKNQSAKNETVKFHMAKIKWSKNKLVIYDSDSIDINGSYDLDYSSTKGYYLSHYKLKLLNEQGDSIILTK